MECMFDGRNCCRKGLRRSAFALWEGSEAPSMELALKFVENNLYYGSTKAERHFLDTGSHRIRILDIQTAG